MQIKKKLFQTRRENNLHFISGIFYQLEVVTEDFFLTIMDIDVMLCLESMMLDFDKLGNFSHISVYDNISRCSVRQCLCDIILLFFLLQSSAQLPVYFLTQL